jgi:hypothetical protein
LGIYGQNFALKIIGNLWPKLWPENYWEFMAETLARKLLGIYGRNFGLKIIGNLRPKLSPGNYDGIYYPKFGLTIT